MSDPISPELEAAKIRNLDAETALRNLEIKRTQLEVERSTQFLQEGKAEAERHRIYNFWGSVNDVSTAMAVKTLGEWSRMYPGEKITIVFNSPGGGVYSGLALFDYIQELRSMGHEIETVAIGYAASMGGILLQAGDKRVMGRNTWMLIHEISSMTGGKSSDIEDDVKRIRRLQDQLTAILAKRSTMSQTQIKNRWKRVDWWLDAEDALKLGFIDEIRG